MSGLPEKLEVDCKTCDGVRLVHSGEPTMYNCELGGDCSKDFPNWTKEDCKKCGKTVPCPECMPEANKYYKLWMRDLKSGNLLSQKNDALAQSNEDLVKALEMARDELATLYDGDTCEVIEKIGQALSNSKEIK